MNVQLDYTLKGCLCMFICTLMKSAAVTYTATHVHSCVFMLHIYGQLFLVLLLVKNLDKAVNNQFGHTTQ